MVFTNLTNNGSLHHFRESRGPVHPPNFTPTVTASMRVLTPLTTKHTSRQSNPTKHPARDVKGAVTSKTTNAAKHLVRPMVLRGISNPNVKF